MTNRERTMAVLNYESYDRMPIVHFGYWPETLDKWANEGHITREEADTWHDGSASDKTIAKKLGFDFNWQPSYLPSTGLNPQFESKVLEELPDGSKKILTGKGLIVLEKEGAGSIPADVGRLLHERKDWEELYLPRLQFSADRVNKTALAAMDDGGPVCIHCGSLFGEIRNWMGVEGISYLYADDEDLYEEIINTVGELCYRVTENALATGIRFDYAHFWEDICFKTGPLVIPAVFEELVAPHYRRITDLLKKHGINIISLDCDGLIDSLLPIWLENGVNTMFPIEVGTWDASIAPWREKYGKELRGVGGMNKNVFAKDYAAVDEEIERLRRLIALGGYIPCPDHRIAPDAKWDNVRYYCEKMLKL